MNRLQQLMHLGCKPVVGMVHLAPSPGSPRFYDQVRDSTQSDDMSDVVGYRAARDARTVEHAVAEARLLEASGVHAIMLENMHDTPYQRPGQLYPTVTALMAKVATELRRQLGPQTPIGIQILSCANREALSVARVCDLDFVRCEGFVFGHLGDEGWADACCSDLVRFRDLVDARHIWLLADIKKKHACHAVTADMSLEQTMEAAAMFHADGVVVTGVSTGQPVDQAELMRLHGHQQQQQQQQQHNPKKQALPVFVGSGATSEALESLLPLVRGLIVGSCLKRSGHWSEPLDELRIRLFMREYHRVIGVK